MLMIAFLCRYQTQHLECGVADISIHLPQTPHSSRHIYRFAEEARASVQFRSILVLSYTGRNAESMSTVVARVFLPPSTQLQPADTRVASRRHHNDMGVQEGDSFCVTRRDAPPFIPPLKVMNIYIFEYQIQKIWLCYLQEMGRSKCCLPSKKGRKLRKNDSSPSNGRFGNAKCE